MSNENIIRFDPSKEIAGFFQYLFRLEPVKPNIVLHSGRSVTKSTFFAIWNIVRLIFFPDADGLVLAYEKSSIGKKVFSNYKEAAKIMRLVEGEDIRFHHGGINSDYFVLVRNHKTNTWNKIFFETGKGGSEMIKGFLPQSGHRWLFCSFYELTNFINLNDQEIASIYATILRSAYSEIIWENIENYCKENNIDFIKDKEWLFTQDWFIINYSKFYSKEFCFEFEFNTPSPGVSYWVMDWISNFRKRDDVYYQFNTYLDFTEREKLKFLKPDMLKEINNIKDNNPIAYNHEYLGKEAYDGSISFPGLSRAKHFGWHENFKPDKIIIGVDVGTEDPTVCVANGIEFDKKPLRVQLGMYSWSYWKRRQWYIKNSKNLPFPPPSKQWKLEDYCNMIREFCDMVHEKHPNVPIVIQFERRGAGILFYNETFKKQGLGYLKRSQNWDTVTQFLRTNTITDMIFTPGVLKIADEFVFNSYKNQINDKKHELETGQIKRLDNYKIQRLTLDVQDATEYGLEKRDYDMIRERVKWNNGEFDWEKEKERQRKLIYGF